MTSTSRLSGAAVLFFTVIRPVPSAERKSGALFARVLPARKLIVDAFGAVTRVAG